MSTKRYPIEPAKPWNPTEGGKPRDGLTSADIVRMVTGDLEHRWRTLQIWGFTPSEAEALVGAGVEDWKANRR